MRKIIQKNSYSNIKKQMSKVSTSTKATVKTTKKTTKIKEEPVVPVVPSPVVESTTVPVEATATVTLDATVAEVESTDATSMKQRFEALIKSKQNFMNDLKREIQDLRKMQRDHEHAVKEASKRSKKKKSHSDDSTPRKPSGFASQLLYLTIFTVSFPNLV